MPGLRLLSETIPKVTGRAFTRKYIMLGRLVTNWEDIVGADMAARTRPAKLRYYKARKQGEKAGASLDIGCAGADATILHYRKDLILERINAIFGERWITAIRFVPEAANAAAPPPPQTRKTLTETEKEHLSRLLANVDDPDLHEKLQSLGSAIMQDGK